MDGQALLKTMLDASGGLDNWKAIKEIVVQGQMSGFLLKLKSKVDDAPLREIRISTTEPFVVVEPYPVVGQRGIFKGDYVRIETLDGTLIKERNFARSYFLRFPYRIRRLFFWDYLDVIYFAGYSIWNYFLTPYMISLPGVTVEEGESIQRMGITFRKLIVHFPPDFHTHSRTQEFFISPNGLVSFFKYQVEVGWPFNLRADHFCSNYRTFDGLTISTRRRAFLQKDKWLRVFRMKFLRESVAMWGEIRDIDTVQVVQPG